MPKAKSAPVAPVPTTSTGLAERFKDFPAIDILERRLLDPSDPGSLPILLADEDPNACTNSQHQNQLRESDVKCRFCKRPVRIWYVRWANTAQEGRWSQIKAKGYVAVEVKDLRDEQDIADLVKRADDDRRTYVRRGDRGQELLVKMPLLWWLRIKSSQRQAINARANSATARKADLAEAAGKALGDEAGQSLHDGLIKEESFHRTRSTLGDEARPDVD